MSIPRFTAGVPCSHSFLAVLLLVVFHAACANAFSLVDCKQANAEAGAKYCKDAFTHTYSENKVKILTSPVKSGCCLTLSLRSCMEFAFTKARCDPKDQKVAIMIREHITEAENHLKHIADQLTTLVCGSYKSEDCENRFLLHFNAAIHNITVLNGSPGLEASMLATSTAALIGSVYAMQWN